MGETYTQTFHIMEEIESGEKKAFVLDKWAPEQRLKIIGVDMGLLCDVGVGWEIYIAVARTDIVAVDDNWASLKKDHLFFAQRDAYSPCTGITDLTKTIMLPANDYVSVHKSNPLYVKVGVINSRETSNKYDAWVTFYYQRRGLCIRRFSPTHD